MASGIPYPGYIHHLLAFTVRDRTLLGFPKVPFVDRIAAQAKESNFDLSFFWSAALRLKIVKDDYLGPSVDAVIGYDYV